MVILDIGDQGIGISDKEKEHVFKIASKTRYKKELGLYIVSEIMKALGGKIEVFNRHESPDDHSKGTIFRLYFREGK